MEPGRRFDALDADEHSNIESRATSDQNDSPSIQCNVDPNMDYENKPGEILKNLQNVSYMYRQDIVRSKTRTRIGIVTEVAGDSDSDSSITDDEDEDAEEADDEAGSNEEGDLENDENSGENVAESNEISDDFKNNPLTADQVRVLWMDGSEMTESTNDVEVIDRGFLHGDYVASASDPTGQIGIVVNVHINVDLLTHDGSITRDIPSRDLKRIRDFTVGDHVILGPWLGRIEDVFDNVTVQLDDGSVCRVMKADPLHLKPLGKNVIEDGHFPYYPGQRVKATSSSVFKNSRWLSGLWKANRLEGTVTKVTVGSVFIYWIASAGYGPDSATTPAEEQNPKNLSLLSCFAHTNWQLGDWCLLPSSEESSVTTLNRGSLKADSHDSAKDEPESTGTGDNSDAEVEQSSRDDRSIENNVDASLSKYFETSENKAFAKDLSSSSLPASKEVPHETWPLHRKKIRRVVVRKDKKSRKKVDNFERALLIINTSTKVDVVWQDGSIKRDLDSTSLIPIDSPGDHEFVAEQYVVEKAADSGDAVETRRVGVVKSVNAKDRTACVRWLKPVARAEDPREFDKDEMVSVYELEGHPDYDYCYGDVVVRLSPISLPDKLDTFVHSVENMPLGNPHQLKQENEKNHEGGHTEKPAHDISAEFSDLSWVGNITGLRDGDIEVTWADGMISTVGPQAIYVVGRDDDESIAAGSDGFDDAASWETVEDEIDNGNQPEDHEAEDVDSGLEIEDDTVASENSGKNGALSIPLAAIGFMTELASGIISRVRRHSDPLDLDVKKDDDLQPEGLTLNSDRDSGSSSRKHYNIEDQLAKLTTKCEGEEQGAAEASDLLEIAETLCNLQPPESNAPRGEFISTFRGFDIVRDPLDHHFLGAHKQNNAARKWLKKVQQDWDILQNNLPEGIYVRAYEDRMDLLRAVIVGAYGTPYQDGLFFFDFHLPQEYPDVPPSAYYHSGGWRINPNLYEEGKVCLSLLNTWTGRGNEVWDPSTSSILQVLVSLQGLVLNSKPYFNEAGYDRQVGTAEGEKNSLSYNENTFLLNCKTMMSQMRRPPKDFEELVSEHFKKRGRFILKACDAYMKGHLIGSLVEDASARDSNDNSNSVGFKLMLAKVLPKLLSALNEVGADCLEFEHLKLTQL